MAGELSPREYVRAILSTAGLPEGAAGGGHAVAADGGAAPRNTAQQDHAFDKTNPRQPRVPPRQMAAARLLLAGRRVMEVAAELGVHRYTVSRWKRQPGFEAEVRRQLDAT